MLEPRWESDAMTEVKLALRGKWLHSLLVAWMFGAAVGYGGKWLGERPQALLSPGTSSLVTVPTDTRDLDEGVVNNANAKTFQLPPPAQSLEDLVQLASNWPDSSVIGRLQLESAVRETTGAQLNAWLQKLAIERNWNISNVLLKRWAQIDPLGAIDSIAAWRPKMRADVMDSLVVHLAREARGVADEIFERLLTEQRSVFLRRYCQFASARDGDAASVKAFLEKHAANDSERAWWSEWIEPALVKASLPVHIGEARVAIGLLPTSQHESAWSEFYRAVLGRFPEPGSALRESVRQGIDEQSPAVRMEFLRRLAGNWAVTDVQGALDWATQLNGDERKAVLESILGRNRRQDPRELAEIVARLPEDDRTPKMIQSIAEELIAVDPVQAANWFLSQPEAANVKMPRELVSEWAKTDHADISRYVEEHPEFLAAQKLSEMDDIATALFRERGSAAFALVDSLADEDQRNRFSLTAMKAWAAEDWQSARAYVEAEPDLEWQGLLVKGVIGAPQDGILDWVKTLDPSVYEEAMPQIVIKSSQTSSAERVADIVADWLENADGKSFEPGGRSRSALSITGIILATADPTAGADLVARLPEGPGRDAAISGVAGVWIGSDPFGAAEWVVGLPAGETRDRALKGLIPSVADAPGTAFALAVELSDPGAQAEQAASVLVDWWHTDRQAASNALKGSNLTDTQKSAIARQLSIGPMEAQP
ncbi:MAG: hypothetical protein ACI9R3_002167 [Verrucomicrobiales bacterium]|jgi:hypothetical protein